MKHKNLQMKKINPQTVKELLNQYQPEKQENVQPISKKVRIYDDPGEVIRTRNKLKRQRTNEIYTDEYFEKFHPVEKTPVSADVA